MLARLPFRLAVFSLCPFSLIFRQWVKADRAVFAVVVEKSQELEPGAHLFRTDEHLEGRQQVRLAILVRIVIQDLEEQMLLELMFCRLNVKPVSLTSSSSSFILFSLSKPWIIPLTRVRSCIVIFNN